MEQQLDVILALVQQLLDRTDKPTTTEYFCTKKAARYLAVSPQYLEIIRCKGGGPKFLTLGQKMIRYTKSELDAWAGSRSRAHTSKEAKKNLSHARPRVSEHTEHLS